MSLLRDTGATDGASKSALRTDDQAHGRVAVVDIGSSSVRLVVYDTPARLPVPIFNEKADCGIAVSEKLWNRPVSNEEPHIPMVSGSTGFQTFRIISTPLGRTPKVVLGCSQAQKHAGRKDPDYMKNIATDPDYAEVRTRMEARLLSILETEDDPRLMEQPCRYEYEPYAGPVDKAWFEGAFKLETINPDR